MPNAAALESPSEASSLPGVSCSFGGKAAAGKPVSRPPPHKVQTQVLALRLLSRLVPQATMRSYRSRRAGNEGGEGEGRGRNEHDAIFGTKEFEAQLAHSEGAEEDTWNANSEPNGSARACAARVRCPPRLAGPTGDNRRPPVVYRVSRIDRIFL